MTVETVLHFTCSCHVERIEADGFIRPNPYVTPSLSWFTDLDEPDITGLGLTRHITGCDRTAHRFEVAREDVTPWGRVRSKLPRRYVDALELAPGALPRHWFISTGRVPLLGRTLPQPPRTLTTEMQLDVQPWDWDALNDIDKETDR